MRTLIVGLLAWIMIGPALAEAQIIAGHNTGHHYREFRLQDTCGTTYSGLSTSLEIGTTGDSVMYQWFGVDTAHIRIPTTRWYTSAGGAQTCGGGSSACEYYFGGLLGTQKNSEVPLAFIENSSSIPIGKVGSLTAGQWGWGDGDSKGYNNLYVYLTDGTDPDGKAVDYIYGDRGCGSPDRYAAMGIENQLDNAAIGGAYLSCVGAGQCTYKAIWDNNGTTTSGTQYTDDVSCEDTSDCDWIITDGGYWDLVADCSCGSCDPCPAACLTVIAGIKSDMDDYIAQIRSDSSSAQIVLIGLQHVESAYDTCLGELDSEYEDLAGDYAYVHFVSLQDYGWSIQGGDWFMADQLHWRFRMQMEVGEKIAQIINAN